MKTYKILFLRKDEWQNPYERIGRIIGRRYSHRGLWWLSQNEAIKMIESQIFSFFINIKKQRISVIVAVNSQGKKYLKAETDIDAPEILLSLPERPDDLCPMYHEVYPCPKYRPADKKAAHI